MNVRMVKTAAGPVRRKFDVVEQTKRHVAIVSDRK